MFRGPRARRLLLAPVALALALSGARCSLLKPASHASDVRSEPDFTAENLQAGGLGVVGVVDRTPHGDTLEVRKDSTDAAARLWSRLHRARKNWRVLPEEELTAALGREGYDSLLAAYGQAPHPASEEFARLATRLREEPRYLVFCALELDMVVETEMPISEASGPECAGLETPGDYYKTTRTLVATFDLYDRVARRFAWHGSITESMSRAKCEERPGLLEAIATEILGGRYPVPPDRTELLDAIFRKLTWSLPEAKQ